MLVCLFTAAGASAQAIEDNADLVWNEEALNATRLARNPPPIAAGHLATFHAAVHDAVVGVTRSDRTWLPAPDPAPDASAEAAAAGAGHLVLRTLWSSWTNPRSLDLALERALERISDRTARERGLAYGGAVAERTLAARARTGWAEPARGPFASPEPGLWRETPPGFCTAVLPRIAEGAVPDGTVGIASLATQGVFPGALIRAGELFQAAAEALARHLRASIQPVLEGPPGPSAASHARSAADLLGSAFGLSLSRSPGDQHLARELARTALTQHHGARSGRFWAVSEEGTASLPWRPLALPSPIRAASLALAIGIDPGPREQLRRALRHTIEFDPLPPAEILIALTRDAESAP